MMLILGALAGTALAMIAPWLTERALKIPLALQRETLAGFYVVAVGLPMLITASALRAALAAANRFDLLNLIRTPSGMLSFAAPALILPFTHSLAWLIAALIANRAVSWVAYLAAILSALPALRTKRRIELACMRPLIGFGAWTTVSNLIIPIMVYLDRFMIGGLLSMAALTAYSIPMEIAGKTVVVPAAISGVMFPAFARSFAVAPAESRRLFERSLKLLGLIMFPVCAMIVTFAPQIISLWIGRRSMLGSSVVVLQILAIGAFVTSVAWIPLALLHGAHRPDLPAKLHLFDFSIYALLLWICVRRFGVTGAAFTWSGRLLVENLVMFAMASNFVTFARGEIVAAGGVFMLSIVVLVAGAFVGEVWIKTLFALGVTVTSGGAAWRWLLVKSEREWVIGYLPAGFGPALEKFAN
jgi:O-antigen/teichoic acid export membrane protein